MEIGEAVVGHLQGDTLDATEAQDAAIASARALIGERIFPQSAPLGIRSPRVLYAVVSDPPWHLMGADASDRDVLMQLLCYGPSYSVARALAKYVVTALQDYMDGTMGGSGGVAVDRVFIEERGVDGFDEGIYRNDSGEEIRGSHFVRVEARICF